MPTSTGTESVLKTALGCGAQGLLFLSCLAAPFGALALGGPWAGLGGSLAVGVLWAYLGPRPFPGFLPGILSMTVWIQCAMVLVLSVIRLVRNWLGAIPG